MSSASADDGFTTRRDEKTLFVRLDNGLDVIVSEAREQPIFSAIVRYRVGGADDPRNLSELAHLAEHLSFRRSRHLARDEWLNLSHLAGVTYQGMTGDDATTYIDIGPIGALPRVLWLERQRMGFVLSALSAEDIVTERRILENERSTVRADRVGGMFWDFVAAELYPPEHPYSPREEGGCIQRCELQHVQWLLQRGYRPDNARLVVVGDFDAAGMLDLVKSSFASLQNPGVRLPARDVGAPRSGERAVTIAAPVPRSRVHLYWHFPHALQDRVWGSRVLAVQLELLLRAQLIGNAALASEIDIGLDMMDLGWLWHIEIELLPGADPKRAELFALAGVEELRRQTHGIDFAQKTALKELLETWEYAPRRAWLLTDAPGERFDLDQVLGELRGFSAADVQRLATDLLGPKPALVVHVRRAVDAARRGELYREVEQ